jgi:hypothetical protein
MSEEDFWSGQNINPYNYEAKKNWLETYGAQSWGDIGGGSYGNPMIARINAIRNVTDQYAASTEEDAGSTVDPFNPDTWTREQQEMIGWNPDQGQTPEEETFVTGPSLNPNYYFQGA